MIGDIEKARKTSKNSQAIGFREEAYTGRIVLVIMSLCVVFSLVVFNNLKAPPGTSIPERRAPSSEPAIGAAPKTPGKPSRSAPKSEIGPLPPGDSAVTAASGALAVSEADLAFLRTKRLLIPVEGVTAGELRDTFYDERSEGRIHQALDIMAPQGTAVIATAGGLVRLHTSDRGGLMIYLTDSSGLFVYYYGHLQRYAEGIYDGQSIRRGEVIGYVGDTGNAGAGNYHLHFGIAKAPAPGKWSGGEPINPYPLLTTR
ncbi:MAG TPA: M23 family metallopeptidase [Blastocatellia bacterium]|nr:M23 family metallopeptidase [Blastocatellia bacterium]